MNLYNDLTENERKIGAYIMLFICTSLATLAVSPLVIMSGYKILYPIMVVGLSYILHASNFHHHFFKTFYNFATKIINVTQSFFSSVNFQLNLNIPKPIPAKPQQPALNGNNQVNQGKAIPPILRNPPAFTPEDLKNIFNDTKKLVVNGVAKKNRSTVYTLNGGGQYVKLNGELPKRGFMQKAILIPAKDEFDKRILCDEKAPKIRILDMDSLTCAREMYRDTQSIPMVLNFANAFSVGGGVEEGSRAQEEDIFRCSDYVASDLYSGEFSYSSGLRRMYNQPIPAVGCIYTPDLFCYKDKNYNWLPEKSPFNAIAVAAVNLGRSARKDGLELRYKFENGKQWEGSERELREHIVNNPKEGWEIYSGIMKEKIRTMLEVCVINGEQHLVLGALGCGAFSHQSFAHFETTERVANCFIEVLKEPRFEFKFKRIDFAVLGKENHNVFLNKFNNEKNEIKPQLEFNLPYPNPNNDVNMLGKQPFVPEVIPDHNPIEVIKEKKPKAALTEPKHIEEYPPYPKLPRQVELERGQPIILRNPAKQIKDDLVQIFNDTKRLAANKKASDIRSTVYALSKGQYLELLGELPEHGFKQKANSIPADYFFDIKPQCDEKAPNIRVLDMDSLTCAREMYRDTHQSSIPMVLNFANAFSVGGGVEEGCRAQEEDIFRCSDYVVSDLYSDKFSYPSGLRRMYNQPIPAEGCIYTPGLTCYKDKDYNLLDEESPFNAIAVAAVNLGRSARRDGLELRYKFENGKLWKGSEWELREHIVNNPKEGWEIYSSIMKEKIRTMLTVCVLNRQQHLVLGALGCGAFSHQSFAPSETTERVAKCFKEVLKEPRFEFQFKRIDFAVLGKENCDVFLNIFKKHINRPKP